MAALPGAGAHAGGSHRHELFPFSRTLVLRGLHFKRRGTPEGTERAIELFRQATSGIRATPGPTPHWGRPDAYGLAVPRLPGGEDRGGEKAAERTLILDPPLAQGHFALGTITWI